MFVICQDRVLQTRLTSGSDIFLTLSVGPPVILRGPEAERCFYSSSSVASSYVTQGRCTNQNHVVCPAFDLWLGAADITYDWFLLKRCCVLE